MPNQFNLWTTTEMNIDPIADNDRIPPSHPGEDILELIEDHGLTQYRLAKALGVQQTRISQIIQGKRSITADTALRLARFFSMSPRYWLNRQMNYDLEMAEIQCGEHIRAEIEPMGVVSNEF